MEKACVFLAAGFAPHSFCVDFVSVTVVRAGHNNNIGTSFTRYFMYAWITPLIVVGSCLIYDTLTKGKIGYGMCCKNRRAPKKI